MESTLGPVPSVASLSRRWLGGPDQSRDSIAHHLCRNSRCKAQRSTRNAAGKGRSLPHHPLCCVIVDCSGHPVTIPLWIWTRDLLQLRLLPDRCLRTSRLGPLGTDKWQVASNRVRDISSHWPEHAYLLLRLRQPPNSNELLRKVGKPQAVGPARCLKSPSLVIYPRR
jgi:hypothetical protein